GPAAVPRGDGGGHAATGDLREPGAPVAVERPRLPRPGNYLSEVPAQGAAPPLCQRGGAGRGLAPLPPGRGDRGEAGAVVRAAGRVRRRPVFWAAVAAVALVLVALFGGGIWLMYDRSAAAREVKAERNATERAAEEDLRDMVARLRASSWPEARAALERARG